MKRVLITGANSYIGCSFEKYLSENYPDDYIVDTVDMHGDWRGRSFAGCDSVFHVAGIAHSDSGKISEEKVCLYYAVNTDLTIEAAKKAKTDGVGQFIFMSSAIVYGDSAPIGESKIITRDTPVAPTNCYGDSKVQAENGICPLNDDTFHVVILRPPMIYGKGCRGNYPFLSKIAQETPVFPYVENQRSMLYIENLCEFVRLIIDNWEQGTFWPQNSEYSNTSELVKTIAQAHGKKVCLIKGAELPLRLLGRFVPMVNKAFGGLSYDVMMSEYRGEKYNKYTLIESVIFTEEA